MHPIVMLWALPAILSDAPSLPVRDGASPLIQMGPPPVLGSTWKEVAPKWEPVTMPTAAHSVLPPSMEQLSALTAEWDKLPTLFIAKGFRKALEADSLTFRYPVLVHDIAYGSPIGALILLSHTNITPNLLSANAPT